MSSSFHCRARDRVGHQDQGRRLGLGHRGRADQGLAGAARQHDDARAAVPERVGRLALVGAQLPLGLVEVDRVRLAVDVPGEVLRRPAELEQRLLEVAALGGVHRDGVVVDAVAEHARDPLGAQHLLQHRPVVRDQHQAVHGVLLQAQPPVPRHRLRDVDEQRVRDGVPAELQQGVDDLLGVVAGRAGVPEAERREPVGVDVLRAALELRERGDRLAALDGLLVVDLEQQGLVALHDQGAVVHPPSLVSRTRDAFLRGRPRACCGRPHAIDLGGLRWARGTTRRRDPAARGSRGALSPGRRLVGPSRGGRGRRTRRPASSGEPCWDSRRRTCSTSVYRSARRTTRRASLPAMARAADECRDLPHRATADYDAARDRCEAVANTLNVQRSPTSDTPLCPSNYICESPQGVKPVAIRTGVR